MCDVRDDCAQCPPDTLQGLWCAFAAARVRFYLLSHKNPSRGVWRVWGHSGGGGCGLRSDTYPVVNLEWEVGDAQMAGGLVRGGVGVVDAGGDA